MEVIVYVRMSFKCLELKEKPRRDQKSVHPIVGTVYMPTVSKRQMPSGSQAWMATNSIRSFNEIKYLYIKVKMFSWYIQQVLRRFEKNMGSRSLEPVVEL